MSTNNMAIAIPENFDNLSDEQLMNLTGQGLVGGDSSSVLSRLSINYQAEDENDNHYREVGFHYVWEIKPFMRKR